jgi:ribonuclease D
MSSLEEIVVASADALQDCCRRLAQATHLGFDTEFVGEETYDPHLCLLQIATPEALYLIDPLSAGPLDVFWQVLIDPARTVIVHAGREEIRMCRRAVSQTPTNWFDLQIAAGLAGHSYPLGHAALVFQILGKQLDKGETLTEWRHRPLSPAQQRYAFDDVRYLLPLWQRLDAKLHDLGRKSWATEEFTRIIGQAVPEATNPTLISEKWRKIRGVGTLDRRRLAVVREMFLCREKIAAEMNRPPRVLVRDDLLLEVARRNPKSAQDVQTIRGMARRFVQPLWEAIERARALPSEQLPKLTERDQDPPQVSLIVNVLAAILNDFCARHELATALTATMSDLKELVRANIQKDGVPESNLLMTGWRKEIVLPRLLEVLEGKRAVRITDLRSETPFSIEEPRDG